MDLGPLSSVPLNFTKLEVPQLDSIISNVAAPFINSSPLYYRLEDGGNETTPIGLWILYDSLNHTVRCELYNATYTANVSYINNVQYIQNNLEFHNSINDGPALDTELQISAEEGVMVTELNIWPSLNLCAMHAYACGVLLGWIADEGLHMMVNSEVAFWRSVVEWSTNFTSSGSTVTPSFPNLATKIQEFMTNVTLSLIDSDNAENDTTTINFTSKPIVETITPATITLFPAVYAYSDVELWQIYGTAVGFGVICVILGGFMLYTNGVAGPL